MDFTHARDRIQASPDVRPLSDVVLALLGAVEALQHELTMERRKLADLQKQFDQHGHDHFTGTQRKNI